MPTENKPAPKVYPFGWLDFSGILAPFFPSPGPVLRPKKGQPVPPPGNPPEKGGSQTSGIAGQVTEGITNALRTFIPSREQKRDFLVYAGAAILLILAVYGILGSRN